MIEINGDILYNWISLYMICIIINLSLMQFRPPIPKHYRNIIVLVLGTVAGSYVIQNLFMGFVISGVVLFRSELPDEVSKTRESVTKLIGMGINPVQGKKK